MRSEDCLDAIFLREEHTHTHTNIQMQVTIETYSLCCNRVTYFVQALCYLAHNTTLIKFSRQNIASPVQNILQHI